jgi:hypothetical protein
MANRLTPCRAGVALGWAALLACCGTSPLEAQRLRLRPAADVSLPTRTSIQNGQLHVSQRIGVTVGARLTISFNRRFEAITGVSYNPGYAMVTGAGRRFSVATRAHVLTAAGDARYWLRSPARTLSWEVHTGIGIAFGGEPAYQDLFESSTLSGILGSTVRCQIGRVVGLRLRIQDRLYRVRFGNRSAGRSSSPLHLSLGLDLPFHRPGS